MIETTSFVCSAPGISELGACEIPGSQFVATAFPVHPTNPEEHNVQGMGRMIHYCSNGDQSCPAPAANDKLFVPLAWGKNHNLYKCQFPDKPSSREIIGEGGNKYSAKYEIKCEQLTQTHGDSDPVMPATISRIGGRANIKLMGNGNDMAHDRDKTLRLNSHYTGAVAGSKEKMTLKCTLVGTLGQKHEEGNIKGLFGKRAGYNADLTSDIKARTLTRVGDEKSQYYVYERSLMNGSQVRAVKCTVVPGATTDVAKTANPVAKGGNIIEEKDMMFGDREQTYLILAGRQGRSAPQSISTFL